MITYLKGTLTSRHPAEAIVEVGGVGLHCRISLATFQALPPEGEQVELVTKLVMRDDGLDLYGFATRAERTLFSMLQGVSGVGPRMAQGILSGLTVEEFARALSTDDLVTLTAIKGVGRKTGERLILELKDKIPQLEAETGATLDAGIPASDTPGWEPEAVLALRSLGYGQSEAERAVRNALDGLEGEPTVESVVKRALTLTR
jgi:Holliday junction DNA helicase RuvA